MNKRTKATSIPQTVKGIVIRRDTSGTTLPRCIFCGSVYGLTIAHYISRANGGLGIEENLACVCMDCHRSLDQSTSRKVMLEWFRQYLDIHYPNFTDEERKYKK